MDKENVIHTDTDTDTHTHTHTHTLEYYSAIYEHGPRLDRGL